MAVTVTEERGRRGQISEAAESQRVYFARDATSEDEALGAVFTHLTGTLGSPPSLAIGTRTLVLKNLDGEEVITWYNGSATLSGWRVTATFGTFQLKEPLQEGESSFAFEIGTAPQRVVVPLGTQSVYKRGADTAPTPNIILIGDQGVPDQEPGGVEIYEPVHTESETHIVAASAVDADYKAAVKGIVGKVNDDSFKGHDAGECLLTAVSGQQRGSADWELSFRWSVRENQTGLSIAGITGIDKEGWQYLWPRYYLARDENGAPILTRQIRYIVVATVFRTADYSGLGIGT